MSIGSNIPGFESEDLVNFEGGSIWIQQAVKFMIKASEKAAELCSERSHFVFTILANLELDGLKNNKNWLINAVDRVRKKCTVSKLVELLYQRPLAYIPKDWMLLVISQPP